MKVLLVCIYSLLTFAPASQSSPLSENGDVTSNLRRKRSYNGEIVRVEDYPYVVSIGEHACAGALITRRLVLTAGHCTRRSSYVKVFTSGMEESYTISRRIPHPSYKLSNGWIAVHDIGLFVLSEPVKDAQVIKLPPKNFKVPTGVFARSFGWGETEHESYSEDLRKLVLPISYYGSYCRKGDEYNSLWICSNSGEKHLCSGDSGGPLVWNNYVVGIASMGAVRCKLHAPSIFTKVAAYRNWIDKYTAEYR
ncbi:hypothetical protein QAD02_010704 [Eretmocerus hayati]|uniref:Uncharacterized protein n=1 Tax=Eretmocerus hayati TaxID=131215 RepID=A0ACC2NUN8_9HYME|nr:hypothetical protein QAD02_010704 [Eretmocerus hayati]